MEKDIKIYYSTKDKAQSIEVFMQKIFLASTMEEAIQAYLDMKTCITPAWIKEYLNRPVVSNGKAIKIKDLPLLKQIKQESHKYVIANFEVIMGISTSESGIPEFLTTKKQELLFGSNETEIKKEFYLKQQLYETLNRAIKERDIATLNSFYSHIETDPCYNWTISYFKLQKFALERKPNQNTSLS